MRIANQTPDPDLSPIVLWQYDKAENLQHLIWHKELVSDTTTGDASVEQTGLCQRIAENAKTIYDDFFTYAFDAINYAIENDVDSLSDSDSVKQKVTFGLSLWSSLLGVSHPQYSENGTIKDVRLRTWASFLKATFFKFRMNGSLYDINRYMKILMPELNVSVVDGGLKGDWIQAEKMTLTYRFETSAGLVTTVGYRMPSYVKNGYTVYFSLVLTFSVDTGTNKFSSIVVTPIVRRVSQDDGSETLCVGSSATCLKEEVGSDIRFKITDIKTQLPESERVNITVTQIVLDTQTESGRKVTRIYFDAEQTGRLPDSKVAPIKDQDGRIVTYEFKDNSDPLMGLPAWTSYIAEDYPEYSEMLEVPGMLPYPAGVNDGNSQMEIKPQRGRYLGIVDSNESISQVNINWAKYTLDHSILLPDNSINPPLEVKSTSGS